MPLFTLAYRSIVAAEENYLAGRFGDVYRAYCARVPRFRITTAGLAQTVSGFEFDWRRLLRKEYGTTFTGCTAILVTLLWDEFQRLGPAGVSHVPRRDADVGQQPAAKIGLRHRARFDTPTLRTVAPPYCAGATAAGHGGGPGFCQRVE